MNKKNGELLLEQEVTDAGVDEVNREAAGIIRSAMQELLEVAYDDENNENDLYNILAADDALQEELVDKMAALNVVLMAAEDEEASREDVEGAYLSLIDTILELSKSVNPIAGFGRDRLLSGLSVLDYFEKNLWPLSTRITADNAEAFRQFIPEEHLDDVLCGRKQAIGVLRLLGEERFAAGAVVFSTDQDIITDLPRLHLHWIEVHEHMRRQGVANMLMALMLEPFLKEDFILAAELSIPRQDERDRQDESDRQDADILENFLDSWRLEFTVSAGSRFTLELASLMGNEEMNVPYDGAVTLDHLGSRGQDLVRDFFKRQKNDEDRELMRLPFTYFDPYGSTCIVKNGRIEALFLVHRFAGGDYRYEALRCPGGYDGPEWGMLLRCAWANVKMRDGFARISGFFDSEEGRDAVTALFPDLDMPMYFYGELMTPEVPITMEMWDDLRGEAGFSNDKLPDIGFEDEDMTKENAALLSGALREML